MRLIKKAAMLAALGVMGIGIQRADAGSVPGIYDLLVFCPQFHDAKGSVGSNGNESILWDSFSGAVGKSTYLGSALWILNPQGQVIASGDTPIPASIGTGLAVASSSTVPDPLSNTAVHVYPSGNTQVVFATNLISGLPTAVSTWTYNSQGKLIAFGGPYGPFVNTLSANISFDGGGVVVRWYYNDITNGGNAVWVLDEFGTVISAAGPYGPFGNTILEKVRYNAASQTQLWQWLVLGAAHHFGLNTWQINSAGTIINASSYGPF